MQAEERVTLAALRQQGMSLRAIAGVLGRSPGSLSREVRRNGGPEGVYVSKPAQRAAEARKAAARAVPKLDPNGPLWPLVAHLLTWLWSPQQIAWTLRRMWPDSPEMHVSHETIYTTIYAYPKGELRKDLIACLRQGRSARKSRSAGEDRRGQIPEMVSIHVRPPEVNDRLMPGHWEGGLHPDGISVGPLCRASLIKQVLIQYFVNHFTQTLHLSVPQTNQLVPAARRFSWNIEP